MKCLRLEPELYHAYENFLSQHPHASIESSVAWGSLQDKTGRRKKGEVFVILESGAIVASAMQVSWRLDYFSKFLWIPAGPLLPEDPELQKLCMGLFLQHWKSSYKDHLFVRIESLVRETTEPNVFTKFGKKSDWSYYPRHTLCLDLTLGNDALWTAMTQKGRYHIKKAIKNEVRVVQSSSQNLSAYYQLMLETAKRDGFTIQSFSYYEAFLAMPSAQLWLAYHDDKVVAGAISISFGSIFLYYFGASSSHDRQIYASYLLQWTMIQEAEKSGFKKYDFFGVADAKNPNDKLQSVTQFKTRFGGFYEHYTPARILILRPCLTALRNGLLNIFRKIRK